MLSVIGTRLRIREHARAKQIVYEEPWQPFILIMRLSTRHGYGVENNPQK